MKNSAKPVILDFYADWCGFMHQYYTVAKITKKLQLKLS
ncbi:MAG: hypothetical protein ACTTK5_04420 [Candidatus Fimenecus sp.]